MSSNNNNKNNPNNNNPPNNHGCSSSSSSSSSSHNNKNDNKVLHPWSAGMSLAQKVFQVTTTPSSQRHRRTRESLPAPPEGMEWIQNEQTYEWRLIKAGTNTNTNANSNTNTCTNRTTDSNNSTTKNNNNNDNNDRNHDTKTSMTYSNISLVEAPSSPPPPSSSLHKSSNNHNTNNAINGGVQPMNGFEPPPTLSLFSRCLMNIVSPERSAVMQNQQQHQQPTTPTTTNTTTNSNNKNSKTKEDTTEYPWKNEKEMNELMLPGLSSSSLSSPLYSPSNNKPKPPPRYPTNNNKGTSTITSSSLSSPSAGAAAVIVDHLPTTFLALQQQQQRRNSSSKPTTSDRGAAEDDWDLLSDRLSNNSNSYSGGYYNNNASNNNKNNSSSNNNNNTVFVQRSSGSIRSINESETGEDDDDNNNNNNSNNTNDNKSFSNLSVPFKIQRTTSNSTIDSNYSDSCGYGGYGGGCGGGYLDLGPSGKGILGIDYVEHIVMPTDTLQGICILYKISTTRLRQANHFTGESLLLAPKKLIIPISKNALRQGYLRVQDTASKEYKVYAFAAEFPDYGLIEAKAYLELADWVLEDAIRAAREDNEWERDIIDSNSVLRSGEIRITMKTSNNMNRDSSIAFQTQGAGIQPIINSNNYNLNSSSIEQPGNNISEHGSDNSDEGNDTPNTISCDTTTSTERDVQEEEVNKEKTTGIVKKGPSIRKKKEKPIVRRLEDIPGTFATKTVQIQDVYRASMEHNNYGVELQSFSKSKRNEDFR